MIKDARVLVQGITGKEGRRATKEMLASGTDVRCGVTPGKAGQEVEGLPVFDSVSEAVEQDGSLDTSVLYVPPLMVYDAAMESMSQGIQTIVIITENVPVQDTARLVEHARSNGCRIIGPGSVGVLDTRAGKIGSIGSQKEAGMYSKGNVGIISKSGGMCAETALVLTQAGLGQSIVIGIGGDVIIGTTFADLLDNFQKDEHTHALVVFGEIGGSYEEQLADALKEGLFRKPLVAFIGGQFAENLPRSLALGHAGAIIEDGRGTANGKKEALRDAGVSVADYHYQIPDLVRDALGG